MKKLLLFIIALFSVTLLSAQRPIVIKGKMENCPNRDRSYIEKRWFNTERLEEETITIDFPIEEDGSFSVSIPKADDFYERYFIHLGNEKTNLDLIAGDSIYMTLNATMFDESIKYSGRGAGRNNYCRDVFLEFWDRDADSKINVGNPAQFLNGLNNLTDRKLELLNKYYLSKEIDSSYYQFEKAMIINEKANLILSNNYRHRNHRHLQDSISRQMNLILKAANFSDDHFMQRPEFRDLIKGLPEYMTENNSIKPGDDIKREIAFAAAHYTPTMQLYFNRENMRKYLWRTQRLSEKYALLNFFDKQFDAPVLKKEIQQHRNSLRNDRVVNSHIFQAFAIAIFMLVVFLGFVFIIFKLIQFSGNRRKMNFNMALALKVAFYLIIGMFALIFMANSNTPLRGMPLVILTLGTFLVHTYMLISRYALKRDPHYFIQLGVGLIAFIGLNIISKQVTGSLFSIVALSDLFFGLILLSWASYYINHLALRKSTIKELIKSGELNLEIASHLVIVFFINLIFLVNISHDGRLNPVLLFYTILVLFYFHTFISFPRFFNKQKALYFIGIQVIILIAASVVMIVLDGVQSYRALQNIGVGTQLSSLFSTRNVRSDLLVVFFLLLIPSFIYYFIKKQLTAMETTGFQLYRKKEAELAQLKSQVNPHFLFNTLNTLYAFALKEGSEKTAECIAKLANLMRFMLDDMEKETILLKREISYIHDYVKLQSIRSAVEHDIAINVDVEDEESFSIAPMLLIPFVENAFKHGMNPNKVSQLKIDIHASGHQMQFVIENSIDENFQAYYKEKGFGIGIENVKSRLRYVYPNRHTISVAKTNTSFIVILNIEE